MTKRRPRSIDAQLTVVKKPSPNHDSRDGDTIAFLVVHDTETESTQATLDIFLNGDPKQPGGRRSAHYVVDDVQGTVYGIVDESETAWHAGVSYWGGARNINSRSIGVECQSTDGNKVAYPPKQVEAIFALLLDIIKRNKIRVLNVVAHSDIAPYRKQDPGAMFPWEAAAAAGIGVWPAPTQADRDKSKSWTPLQVQSQLLALGYQPDHMNLPQLVTAFQRRWQPEAIRSGNGGTIDDETKARLANLVRRKASFDKISAARRKSAP